MPAIQPQETGAVRVRLVEQRVIGRHVRITRATFRFYSNDPSRRHTVAYASTGGQTHTRVRSPYAASIRPIGGQILWSLVAAVGKPARPRAYGPSQLSARKTASGWGEVFSRLDS